MSRLSSQPLAENLFSSSPLTNNQIPESITFWSASNDPPLLHQNRNQKVPATSR